MKNKIIAISDTHGNDFAHLIPECDILLICGDISPVKMPHNHNSQKGWLHKRFIPVLQDLRNRAKNIVLTAGNHDVYLFNLYEKDNEQEIIRALPPNVHYLGRNPVVEINGLKIYGTPWVNLPVWASAGPPVWNFATSNGVFLDKLFEDIPNDVDIILSHGPCYGFCDKILDSKVVCLATEMYKDSLKAENLGSVPLWNRLIKLSEQSNKKEIWVISGHIHSADHVPQSYRNLKFACSSLLDEGYRIEYPPLEIWA